MGARERGVDFFIARGEKPTHGRGVGVAEELIRSASIPQAARIDALHVASATLGGVNYFLTQNFAHIADAVTIRTIYGVLDRLGLGLLLICTPAEFLGGPDDGSE